ncbi:ABC transporter substrate-binding protein [Nocardioides sp. Bht2]|uniref:ABC transporter substrate-binding protein n=1 Tax=Nocardioides sp. Bht2 TaxID=3392297 RepID=UPI0039B45F55
MRLSPVLRRALAGSAALVLAGSLSACWADDDDKADSQSGETRVVVDDTGKEITIPATPEKVIATGYAVPALLEVDAPLVGISEWSRGLNLMTDEDRTSYDELDKVAGESAASTNYDAIAELEPDLIIIGVPQPAVVDLNLDRLKQIAPVVQLGPSRPDKWKELNAKQADAAGMSANLEENKAAYEAKAAELTAKYTDVLDGVRFGHVGGYGDVSAGNFQREFAGSWGTNIATDIGVTYYGEVKKAEGGSSDVSEYPAIEELPASLGEADVITYSVEDSGKPGAAVQYVLDSPLFKNLAAAKSGLTVPFKFTEAATYATAMTTLDEIDKAFAQAFAEDLK